LRGGAAGRARQLRRPPDRHPLGPRPRRPSAGAGQPVKRVLQLWRALAIAAGIWFAIREIRVRALPPSVPTAVARRGEFLVTVTVRGSLEAQRSVEVIAPRITGS